jgi:hypothetical protein
VSHADTQEIRQSLVDLKDRIDSLESALEEEKNKNQQQYQRVQELENQLNKFSVEKIAEEEKALLANFCEVRNLPADTLIDPIATTLNLSQQIRFPLLIEDFTCSTSNGVLSIEFKSIFQKRGFVSAGKLFNRLKQKFNHRHKIFVNDKLTSTEKKLLYESKVYGNSAGYKFIWHVNGTTHIKKDENATPILIKSSFDLLNLKEADRNLLSEHERTEDEN